MKSLIAGQLLALLIILSSSVPSAAQAVCRLTPTPGMQGRQSLQCGDAARVDGAADANFQPSDATGVVLNAGQVLATVRKRATAAARGNEKQPFEFQIRTPHAIASVRGTIWSVDVRNGQTAIYVKDGSVAVERVADGSRVTLKCDQGADIISGETGPITVRNWPRRRSDSFLRTFGLRGGCARARKR